MDHPVTAYSRRFARNLPVPKTPRPVRTLDQDDLQLHVAGTEQEFDIAHRLAHDAYVDAGYCDPTPHGRLDHYQEFDALPATRVFLVRQEDRWVGTVSFTCESEQGLPIDEGFMEDIRLMRDQGRRVGVVWRLATLPAYRHSLHLVNNLLTACVKWKLEQGLDTSLMMVHARHLRFYRRCFSMKLVRKVEGVSKFSRIPVVLVRCDREDLPQRWLQRATAGMCRQ